MNPLFLTIHLSFGLVSWVLYFMVNRYIYQHKKQFNSAFRKVWFTFTLVNFLQFVAMKLYYQIPLHIPGDSPIADSLRNFPYQRPLTILYFLAYYFIHCQRICVLLIISISFRIIVFPFTNTPIWERHYFVTAFIIFAVPIPFVYSILYTSPIFNYFEELDGFILCPSIIKRPHVVIKTILKSNLFEITTSILSAVMKIATLCYLSSSNVKKRDDRNYYVVTTVLFVTSILKFTCAILMVLNLNVYIEMVVVYIYPMTADCVALSSPYALLYINSKMRRDIFRCKKLQKFRWREESPDPAEV